MREYYILTLDPRFSEVFNWICANHLISNMHLNRTRFWVPDDSPIAVEFALRFLDSCPLVNE